MIPSRTEDSNSARPVTAGLPPVPIIPPVPEPPPEPVVVVVVVPVVVVPPCTTVQLAPAAAPRGASISSQVAARAVRVRRVIRSPSVADPGPYRPGILEFETIG